jgi:hypothetical protein
MCRGDLAFGYGVELADSLRAVQLYQDRMCCIDAADHPRFSGNVTVHGRRRILIAHDGPVR